jgi:branched-chain amino acid transport system substrate-binding protein
MTPCARRVRALTFPLARRSDRALGDHMVIRRRAVLAAGASFLAAPAIVGRAAAAEKIIKIGNTMPYSGPASAYAPIGRGDAAYFKMMNETGVLGQNKIDFISLDDSYSPPKTVEDARRLVEADKVDFLFCTLGTPTSMSIRRYCNQRKIPQLFIASGASAWNEPKKYPWTMGWQPSYRTEAQIYAKYLLKEKPDAKLAILYQNDDFGMDYYNGVKDVLGEKFNKMVVQTATYEVTDPTIDSQITQLQSSGADALLTVVAPKFAVQAIRKVHELDWHPLFFMTNVSISVGAVMDPAGPENAVGMISTSYVKDATDPRWKDDPGLKEFLAFVTKYLPQANLKDANYIYAYSISMTLRHVLEKCNGDFSRENVMKQATSIHDLEIPTLLPGIKLNTSPTDYRPIKAMQLVRWTGKEWQLFGNIIEVV